MPHFFIKQNDIFNERIIITDKDNYNHIAKSLRSRAGEKLMLIDENSLEYETVIEKIDRNSITAKIINSYKSNRRLDFNLYLAQSPLRSDAQNIIMEKAAELGVKGVYPVLTDNCALNSSVIEKKIPKWQRIMYEASKQCERADIPRCFELTNLRSVTDNGFDKVIAFCEKNTDKSLHGFVSESPIKAGDKLLVIIGPEGGFSEDEFKLFEELNIPMLTLGKLILKAETAVITAIGNIIYEYGNYGKN